MEVYPHTFKLNHRRKLSLKCAIGVTETPDEGRKEGVNFGHYYVVESNL